MIAPPRPPSHDEPELLIEEARARQLRRRLLGVAGAPIAAAVGLGIYALARGVGHQSATGGSARSGVRPCRAPYLATSAEAGAGEEAGNAGAAIQIVDTSSQACVLPTGLPTVMLLRVPA